MAFDRREFLRASGAAALLLSAPAERVVGAAQAAAASSGAWDAGMVRHLLPTVSDSRMLVKVSFSAPLAEAPVLRVGDTSVRGRMSDTRGEFWQFYATDLKPDSPYRLSLADGRGRTLCEPWDLATFPGLDARPAQLRVLFYSCAGGHEAMEFLPPAVRNRLLRRALSFGPQAAVANGDHVYWDLLSPLLAKRYGASPLAEKIAGRFERAGVVLGGDNESVLKRAAGPQICPTSRARAACRGRRQPIGPRAFRNASARSATGAWRKCCSTTFAARSRSRGRARSMSIPKRRNG